MAFKTVGIDCSHSSLARLNEISQHGPAASQIEIMLIGPERPRDEVEYKAIQDQLSDSSLSKRQRKEAARRLEDADLKEVDRAFMETSAAAGIMLSKALEKMPKLRRMFMLGQRRMDAPNEDILPPSQRTTSRLFSMILSSLALSRVQLEKLEVQHFGCDYPDQGISLRALCVPPEYRYCLSKLSKLELAIETNESSLPNTPASLSSIDLFLKHTPLLTELCLSFVSTNWKDTKAILGRIARSVVLPQLKRLDFNGMRCAGIDLKRFLQNHQALQVVHFANLDIDGPGTFTNILDSLADLQHLTDFKSRQIAQNGFRTTFPTLCLVEVSSPSLGWDALVREFGEEITDEPISMVNQHPYSGGAEEWEGVSEKLRDLSRDLFVTDQSRSSDYSGFYVWW
ncbi:hypothetical protein BLS_001710 [Venturia inaequalis]|nr:hypothetical protein BLS_001710 [Venturia inaequalis]